MPVFEIHAPFFYFKQCALCLLYIDPCIQEILKKKMHSLAGIETVSLLEEKPLFDPVCFLAKLQRASQFSKGKYKEKIEP